MRLAIDQAHVRTGDFEAALEHMLNASRMAAEQGADLIVYSMGLTGELMGQPSVSLDDYLVDRHEFICALERQLECPALMVYDSGRGTTGDAMCLYIHDRQTDLVRSESAYSRENGFIEVAGVRIMPAMELSTFGCVRAGDIDVALYFEPFSFAHHSPERLLAPKASESEAKEIAQDLNAWFVGVGSVGMTQGFVYAGGSYAMAPWGELACALPSFENGFAVVEIDSSFEGPLADPVRVDDPDSSMLMYSAIRRGIADAVAASPFIGACVVVDGTLESSLVAAAAVDALGPLWVQGLVVDTGDEQAFYDAQALARNLRMRTTVQTLKEREAMLATMDGTGVSERDLICLSLRALATSINFMPLECATKTMLALDDSALVDPEHSLAPIGDAYTSDVLDLAGWRMSVSSVIPSGVLSRAWVPSLEGLNPGIAARTALREVDIVLYKLFDMGRSASTLYAEASRGVLERAIVERMEDVMERRSCVPYTIRVNNRPYDLARNLRGLVWRSGAADSKQALEIYDARADGELASMGGLFEEDMLTAVFPDALSGREDVAAAADMMGELLGEIDENDPSIAALESLSDDQIAGAVAQAMSYLQDLLRDAAESPEGGAGPQPGEGPMGMWGQNLFSQN